MKLRYTYSWEEKLWKNQDSILKSRDRTLLTKVHVVKAMAFPVVMKRYESWTIKKAEHWRIDALKLWCWRRLLRVPWTARRSNELFLKEINPEYSLERLTIQAELPILCPLDVKNCLIGKDPDAGKDWEHEEKWATEDEMVGCHHQLNGHEFEQTPKIKSATTSNVSPPISHEVIEPDAMIFVFWMLIFVFHSPLSLSSRGVLVLLHFLSKGWCHRQIWGYWYFTRQSWYQLVLHPVQCFS